MCPFDDGDNDGDDADADADDVDGPAGIQQHQLHPERLSAAAAHPAGFTPPESQESEQHRSSNRRPALTHTRTPACSLLVFMCVLLYSKDEC